MKKLLLRIIFIYSSTILKGCKRKFRFSKLTNKRKLDTKMFKIGNFYFEEKWVDRGTSLMYFVADEEYEESAQ